MAIKVQKFKFDMKYINEVETGDKKMDNGDINSF